MNAAAGWLEGFWVAIALHLWQSTVVLLALATLALGLRRAPARYPQALLWLALVKFAVPLALVAVVLEPLLSLIHI